VDMGKCISLWQMCCIWWGCLRLLLPNILVNTVIGLLFLNNVLCCYIGVCVLTVGTPLLSLDL
jgi:hypothetical protein